MNIKNKNLVLGDVFKYGIPSAICIQKLRIKRDLTATKGLVLGEIIELATDVAQVHLITVPSGSLSSGTYRLGYKGQWTTELDYDASTTDMKTAFELLSTVDDEVTFSNILTMGTTITWSTEGKKDEIDILPINLKMGSLDVSSYISIKVYTVGSIDSDCVKVTTGSNAEGILLEEVTLEDLNDNNNIIRSVLVEGPSIVCGNNLYCDPDQLTDALIALDGYGITIRYEPEVYESGINE